MTTPAASAGPPVTPPAVAPPYPPSPASLDPGPPAPADTPAPPQEWQNITGVWEHANWLGAAFLKELMGEALSTQSVSNTDKPELARALSGSKAKYIAVLNDSDEVQSLIDRSKLVDQFVARWAATTG